MLQAIDTIKEMNRHSKRKIPEDAPLNFVPNRWKKHVFSDDGSIDRHYYEMAVLTELRNLVRSGNVSITGADNIKILKSIWYQKSVGKREA